jgi:signal transduction histidine kinase
MAPAPTDQTAIFLSTLPAQARDRWLAAAVVIVSAAIFAAAAPFAKVPLAPIGAFIPIYESALVVTDLITAALLFGQFALLRTRGLPVLASGYLFTTFVAAAHLLTFPGAFSPTGLLGAGPQSTAWLYMFWHAGFPLLVCGYALLERPVDEDRPRSTRVMRTIAMSAAVVLAAACALTLLATAGHGQLPPIMQGNRYTPAMIVVVSSVWVLSMIALFLLWRRRPRTILDLWLMVVMCAWLFDIALSAVLNAGRFDLGFYAGRIYGLAASSFILLVLLLENGALYRRLADTHAMHTRRLDILRKIDSAIAAEESPEAIAGAVIQPLRQLLGAARAVINVFDLPAGEVEWLAAAGRRRTHVGSGVRYSIRMMGDPEALARGEPQQIDTHALPPGPEVEALLASGVHAYVVMPMIAGGELIGAVSFGGERAHFPAEQMAIAREVATQLAIAVAQARLYARIKQHAQELERRVAERTAELETANKELDAFSYSVSHDLRAPLRAVDGYARMLEDDYAAKLDAEGNRLLGVVRANSQKMGQLIDELLAFSRLGRAPLQTRSVPMEPLVQQVIAELSAEASHRRIEFSVASLGAAEADPTLLKQALANLVSNAIKFTRHKDPARIEIGCRNGKDASEPAIYYVTDNGAGFEMKYYDKLFGVFQRLHSTSEYPGTGVGLAIVQRVIHRHGGRIWAEGKPGEGATFYFTLRHEGRPISAPG